MIFRSILDFSGRTLRTTANSVRSAALATGPLAWIIPVVKRVEQLLYMSEYKRRQAPPGVKITRRNFGRDRRYPITNAFRDTRDV